MRWEGCAELINYSLMLLCICALLTDLLVRPILLLSHIGLDILCLFSSTTLYWDNINAWNSFFHLHYPRMWLVPGGERSSKFFRVADAQMKIKSEDCNPQRVSTSLGICFEV